LHLVRTENRLGAPDQARSGPSLETALSGLASFSVVIISKRYPAKAIHESIGDKESVKRDRRKGGGGGEQLIGPRFRAQ
jgi:hypothetical protein